MSTKQSALDELFDHLPEYNNDFWLYIPGAKEYQMRRSL
jgi:hypothetical protein